MFNIRRKLIALIRSIIADEFRKRDLLSLPNFILVTQKHPKTGVVEQYVKRCTDNDGRYIEFGSQLIRSTSAQMSIEALLTTIINASGMKIEITPPVESQVKITCGNK